MTTATITNLTRGCVLAQNAYVPETAEERRIGLLELDKLDPGEGLLLLDCDKIHTIGMQFAIDVCFCDGRGLVKFCGTILPEKRLVSLQGARFVVELPLGMLKATGTQLGDHVALSFS